MGEETKSVRRSSRDRDDGDRREKKRERTRERDRERSRSRERKKSRKSKKEKRSKRDRDEKKKRKKKDKSSSRGDKKRTRRRRHEDDDASSSSGSGSGSDSDSSESEREHAPTVDRERAAAVVRTLLGEFPAIAPDLLALLQMLDDGETAIISGIANARVKTLLGTLFPLLGLKKLRKPDDAYVAGKSSKDSLLETVAEMLASSDGKEGSTEHEQPSDGHGADADESQGATPSVAEARRHQAPIGPTMPPPASSASAFTSQDADSTHHDDDDDDDYIGPALPGMKGFRQADERVEAEMARRAKQLEEDEWRRARGEAPLSSGQKPAAGGREAWMTQMPENNKIFEDAMGGAAMMKRTSGKPAAFRSKEPAAIDSTWFDAPEERERAKRAKLDMELLGYVRPENAAAPQSSDAARPAVGGPSVNESILPAANPEADQDMRRQMDALREKRGPSLLEQHQQKLAAEQQKTKAAGGAEKSTWNRDRDLTARRGLSRDDADRIITASKEISSKFTAPTVTRQFL